MGQHLKEKVQRQLVRTQYESWVRKFGSLIPNVTDVFRVNDQPNDQSIVQSTPAPPLYNFTASPSYSIRSPFQNWSDRPEFFESLIMPAFKQFLAHHGSDAFVLLKNEENNSQALLTLPKNEEESGQAIKIEDNPPPTLIKSECDAKLPSITNGKEEYPPLVEINVEKPKHAFKSPETFLRPVSHRHQPQQQMDYVADGISETGPSYRHRVSPSHSSRDMSHPSIPSRQSSRKSSKKSSKKSSRRSQQSSSHRSQDSRSRQSSRSKKSSGGRSKKSSSGGSDPSSSKHSTSNSHSTSTRVSRRLYEGPAHEFNPSLGYRHGGTPPEDPNPPGVISDVSDEPSEDESLTLQDLRKKLKWDVDNFPELRLDSEWPQYRISLWLAAASAGLSQFVPPHNTAAYPLVSKDPGLIRRNDPRANIKRKKFTIRNSWLLNMYTKKLWTVKGRELVKKHARLMDQGNAYQLLQALDEYYTVTVNGETFKAAYLEIIQEHVREWKDSYESFLSRWVDTWEKLADLDDNYEQDLIKTSHFLNFLRNHPVFQVMISQNEVVLTHLVNEH